MQTKKNISTQSRVSFYSSLSKLYVQSYYINSEITSLKKGTRQRYQKNIVTCGLFKIRNFTRYFFPYFLLAKKKKYEQDPIHLFDFLNIYIKKRKECAFIYSRRATKKFHSARRKVKIGFIYLERSTKGEQLIAKLSRYLPEGGPGWNFTRIALHRVISHRDPRD